MYRFYQNGQLLATCPNVVTDEGKRLIMRYLAGQAKAIGGSIGVGTGSAAVATSDSRLTHEFDRATIYLTSPDYLNKKIIYKGSINERTVGSIHEVGLFSAELPSVGGGSPSRALASFERDLEAWTGGTYASGNHRIGFEALRLAPAASGSVSSVLPVSLDLAGYSNSDVFSVAVHNLNANTSSLSLRFRGTDDLTHYAFTTTAAVPVGYTVFNFAKSSFVKTGAVDWSLINSIQLTVNAGAGGAAQVDWDGIRVESTALDEDNVLVSHALLTTPISKTEGVAMDIEYALEVAI